MCGRFNSGGAFGTVVSPARTRRRARGPPRPSDARPRALRAAIGRPPSRGRPAPVPSRRRGIPLSTARRPVPAGRWARGPPAVPRSRPAPRREGRYRSYRSARRCGTYYRRSGAHHEVGCSTKIPTGSSASSGKSQGGSETAIRSLLATSGPRPGRCDSRTRPRTQAIDPPTDTPRSRPFLYQNTTPPHPYPRGPDLENGRLTRLRHL